MHRSSSSNGLGSRNSSSNNLARAALGPPLETRFANWQPSERILAMTQQQIVDARERLNVTVDGDPSSSGADGADDVAPIESFDDMVRGECCCRCCHME